jgi:hypothetical protein
MGINFTAGGTESSESAWEAGHCDWEWQVGASECGQRASFNWDRHFADEPHWYLSGFGRACSLAGERDRLGRLFWRLAETNFEFGFRYVIWLGKPGTRRW